MTFRIVGQGQGPIQKDDPVFAKVSGQTVTDDYVKRHQSLSNIRELLIAAIAKKIEEIYPHIPHAQSREYAGQIVDRKNLATTLRNQMIQGRVLNQGGAPFFQGTVQLDDKELNLHLRASDLVALQSNQLREIHPRDTKADVVRDLWIDSQYKSLREKGHLKPAVFESEENLLSQFSDPSFAALDADQKKNFQILAADLYREEKEKALRQYFETRKENFDQALRKGILESRIAAQTNTTVPVAIGATTESKPYTAALTDYSEAIFARLLESGILRPDQKPAELTQQLELIFKIADTAFGLSGADDLKLAEDLASIAQKLTGAEKERFLRLVHFAAVDLPNIFAQPTHAFLEMSDGKDTYHFTMADLKNESSRLRTQERQQFEESVANAAYIKFLGEKWSEIFPGQKLPIDTDNPQSSIAKAFETLENAISKKADYVKWQQDLAVRVQTIGKASIKDMRATLGAEFDSIAQQIKSPAEVTAQAIQNLIEPHVQNRWLRQKNLAPITSDAIRVDMAQEATRPGVKESEKLSFDDTRRKLFAKFFLSPLNTDGKKDYGAWLTEEVDKTLTIFHAPILKDPQSFKALRQLFREMNITATETAHDFAIAVTDLAPFILGDAFVTKASLDDVLVKFTESLAGKTPDQQKHLLRRLQWMRAIRSSLGKEVVFESDHNAAIKNPFALLNTQTLEAMPLHRLIFSIQRPIFVGVTDFEAKEHYAFWLELRSALAQIKNTYDANQTNDLSSYGSQVSLRLTPEGAVHVDFKREDQTINLVLDGQIKNGTDAFWKSLTTPQAKDPNPDTQQARDIILSFSRDLLRLIADPDVNPADFFKMLPPSANGASALLMKNPKFLAFIREQAVLFFHQEILQSLLRGQRPNLDALYKRYEGIFGAAETAKLKNDLPGFFYKDTHLKTVRHQETKGVLAQYLASKLWANPNATDVDAVTHFKDFPFPAEMLKALNEEIAVLKSDFLTYTQNGTIPWDAIRGDIKQAILDLGFVGSITELTVENEFNLLSLIGSKLAREDKKSGFILAFSEGLRLLRSNQGRQLIRATAPLLSGQETINVAHFYLLAQNSALPPELSATALKQIFSDYSNSGLINLMAEIKTKADPKTGALTFVPTQSAMRLTDNPVINAHLALDRTQLTLQNNGQVNLINENKSLNNAEGARHTAIALDLLTQNFGESYARAYWAAHYEFDTTKGLIKKPSPSAMPSVQNLVEAVLNQYRFFPASTPLAKAFIAQCEKSLTDGFVDRIKTVADAEVHRWNQERGFATGEFTMPPPQFLSMGLERFSGWLNEVSIRLHVAEPHSQPGSLFESLADDPVLAEYSRKSPKEYQAAIEKLKALPTGAWQASEGELLIVATILRRLGFPISELPLLNGHQRPFVQSDGFVPQALQKEIETLLENTLRMPVAATPNWPVQLIQSLKVQNQTLVRANVRAEDLVGSIPKASDMQGIAVAVITDSNRVTSYRIGDDPLLRHLIAAQQTVGVPLASGKIDQAAADAFVAQYFVKDTEKRLEGLLARIATMEGILGDIAKNGFSLPAFLETLHRQNSAIKTLIETQSATLSLEGQKPAAHFETEFVVRNALRNPKDLAALIDAFQPLIDTLEKRASQRDGGFLRTTLKEALTLTGLSLEDQAAILQMAKGATVTDFLTLLKNSTLSVHTPNLAVAIFSAAREKGLSMGQDLNIVSILDALGENSNRDRLAKGLLNDLAFAGDIATADIETAQARVRQASATAPFNSGEFLAALKQLREALATMKATVEPGSKATGIFSSMASAWTYFRRTARLPDADVGSHFDQMRFLLSQGHLAYDRFNDAFVKNTFKVESAEIYLAQEKTLTVAKEGEKGREFIQGKFINTDFLRHIGAHQMLADTILTPTQIASDGKTSAVAQLAKFCERFGQALPLNQLIAFNKPVIGKSIPLPIHHNDATQLQASLLEHNARAHNLITAALLAANQSGASPTPEEEAMAVDVVNRMLAGKLWFTITHSGLRSGTPSNTALKDATVLVITRNGKGTEVLDESSAEGKLTYRLIKGLLMNFNTWDHTQKNLEGDYTPKGLSVLSNFMMMLRQEAGADYGGKALEMLLAAQPLLQATDLTQSDVNPHMLAEFAQEQAVKTLGELFSLTADKLKWKHAHEASFEAFILKNCDEALRTIQDDKRPNPSNRDTAIAAWLKAKPENMAKMHRLLVHFNREMINQLAQQQIRPFGDLNTQQFATNAISETAATLSTMTQIFYGNQGARLQALKGLDVVTFDKGLLQLAIDQSNGKAGVKTLRSFLCDDVFANLEMSTSSADDDKRLRALIFYLRRELNNPQFGLVDLHQGLIGNRSAITEAIERMSPLDARAALQRADSPRAQTLTLDDTNRVILETQFIASRLSKTGVTGTTRVITPVSLQFENYTPTPYGTRMVTEVYKPGTPLIPRIIDGNFYDIDPCHELHERAPIFSIRLFLSSNKAGNESPIRVFDGEATAHNSHLNASDLRALAKMLEQGSWFPDKQQPRQENIQILRHFANQMDETNRFRISNIFIKIPSKEQLPAMAASMGLNPSNTQDMEDLRNYFKVIHIFENFHDALGSLVVVPGEQQRKEQREANAAMRRAANEDPSLLSEAWGAVQGTGYFFSDVGSDLFRAPAPPKIRLTNQVVDFRILQVKEVLFKDELEVLQAIPKSQLSETQKRELAYLRSTAIDDRFLERFIKHPKYGNILTPGLFRRHIEHFLQSKPFSEQEQRIIQDAQNNPLALFENIIQDMREKRSLYGADFSWRTLNVNFGEINADTAFKEQNERLRVAKLMLQTAIMRDDIKLNDGNESTFEIAADWVWNNAYTKMLRYNYKQGNPLFPFAEAAHAKSIKAHYLQGGQLESTAGITLFDDTLTSPVLKAAVKDFAQFLQNYSTPDDRAIFIESIRHSIPPIVIPGSTPQEQFAYLEKSLAALVELSSKENTRITLHNHSVNGATETEQMAEKALQYLALFVLPMESKGTERMYNIGTALMGEVGDLELSSLNIVSEVKDSSAVPAKGIVSVASEYFTEPVDQYYGEGAGKIGGRLWHEFTQARGYEFLYFRTMIHTSIAHGLKGAPLVQLFGGTSAGGLDMAKAFLKHRLTFWGFNNNPWIMVGPTFMRMANTDDPAELTALWFRLYALDMPMSRDGLVNSGRALHRVTRGALAKVFGERYIFRGASQTGVNWYGIDNQLRTGLMDAQTARAFPAGRVTHFNDLLSTTPHDTAGFQSTDQIWQDTPRRGFSQWLRQSLRRGRSIAWGYARGHHVELALRLFIDNMSKGIAALDHGFYAATGGRRLLGNFRPVDATLRWLRRAPGRQFQTEIPDQTRSNAPTAMADLTVDQLWKLRVDPELLFGDAGNEGSTHRFQSQRMGLFSHLQEYLRHKTENGHHPVLEKIRNILQQGLVTSIRDWAIRGSNFFHLAQNFDRAMACEQRISEVRQQIAPLEAEITRLRAQSSALRLLPPDQQPADIDARLAQIQADEMAIRENLKEVRKGLAALEKEFKTFNVDEYRGKIKDAQARLNAVKHARTGNYTTTEAQNLFRDLTAHNANVLLVSQKIQTRFNDLSNTLETTKQQLAVARGQSPVDAARMATLEQNVADLTLHCSELERLLRATPFQGEAMRLWADIQEAQRFNRPTTTIFGRLHERIAFYERIVEDCRSRLRLGGVTSLDRFDQDPVIQKTRAEMADAQRQIKQMRGILQGTQEPTWRATWGRALWTVLQPLNVRLNRIFMENPQYRDVDLLKAAFDHHANHTPAIKAFLEAHPDLKQLVTDLRRTPFALGNPRNDVGVNELLKNKHYENYLLKILQRPDAADYLKRKTTIALRAQYERIVPDLICRMVEEPHNKMFHFEIWDSHFTRDNLAGAARGQGSGPRAPQGPINQRTGSVTLAISRDQFTQLLHIMHANPGMNFYGQMMDDLRTVRDTLTRGESPLSRTPNPANPMQPTRMQLFKYEQLAWDLMLNPENRILVAEIFRGDALKQFAIDHVLTANEKANVETQGKAFEELHRNPQRLQEALARLNRGEIVIDQQKQLRLRNEVAQHALQKIGNLLTQINDGYQGVGKASFLCQLFMVNPQHVALNNALAIARANGLSWKGADDALQHLYDHGPNAQAGRQISPREWAEFRQKYRSTALTRRMRAARAQMAGSGVAGLFIGVATMALSNSLFAQSAPVDAQYAGNQNRNNKPDEGSFLDNPIVGLAGIVGGGVALDAALQSVIPSAGISAEHQKAIDAAREQLRQRLAQSTQSAQAGRYAAAQAGNTTNAAGLARTALHDIAKAQEAAFKHAERMTRARAFGGSAAILTAGLEVYHNREDLFGTGNALRTDAIVDTATSVFVAGGVAYALAATGVVAPIAIAVMVGGHLIWVAIGGPEMWDKLKTSVYVSFDYDIDIARDVLHFRDKGAWFGHNISGERLVMLRTEELQRVLNGQISFGSDTGNIADNGAETDLENKDFLYKLAHDPQFKKEFTEAIKTRFGQIVFDQAKTADPQTFSQMLFQGESLRRQLHIDEGFSGQTEVCAGLLQSVTQQSIFGTDDPPGLKDAYDQARATLDENLLRDVVSSPKVAEELKPFLAKDPDFLANHALRSVDEKIKAALTADDLLKKLAERKPFLAAQIHVERLAVNQALRTLITDTQAQIATLRKRPLPPIALSAAGLLQGIDRRLQEAMGLAVNDFARIKTSILESQQQMLTQVRDEVLAGNEGDTVAFEAMRLFNTCVVELQLIDEEIALAKTPEACKILHEKALAIIGKLPAKDLQHPLLLTSRFKHERALGQVSAALTTATALKDGALAAGDTEAYSQALFAMAEMIEAIPEMGKDLIAGEHTKEFAVGGSPEEATIAYETRRLQPDRYSAVRHGRVERDLPSAFGQPVLTPHERILEAITDYIGHTQRAAANIPEAMKETFIADAAAGFENLLNVAPPDLITQLLSQNPLQPVGKMRGIDHTKVLAGPVGQKALRALQTFRAGVLAGHLPKAESNALLTTTVERQIDGQGKVTYVLTTQALNPATVVAADAAKENIAPAFKAFFDEAKKRLGPAAVWKTILKPQIKADHVKTTDHLHGTRMEYEISSDNAVDGKKERTSRTTGNTLKVRAIEALDKTPGLLTPEYIVEHGLSFTIETLQTRIAAMPEGEAKRAMGNFASRLADAEDGSLISSLDAYDFLTRDLTPDQKANLNQTLREKSMETFFGPTQKQSIYHEQVSEQLGYIAQNLALELRNEKLNPYVPLDVFGLSTSDQSFKDPMFSFGGSRSTLPKEISSKLDEALGAMFDPDILAQQLLLHRLGLLDPRKMDGLRNADTRQAMTHLRFALDMQDKPLHEVLAEAVQYLNQPFDVDRKAAAILACADFTVAGVFPATEEQAWARTLLGLTKKQIHQLNERLKQLRDRKSLQELLDVEMTSGEFDHSVIQNLYRGWNDPEGQTGAIGSVKIFDQGNAATATYSPFNERILGGDHRAILDLQVFEEAQGVNQLRDLIWGHFRQDPKFSFEMIRLLQDTFGANPQALVSVKFSRTTNGSGGLFYVSIDHRNGLPQQQLVLQQKPSATESTNNPFEMNPTPALSLSLPTLPLAPSPSFPSLPMLTSLPSLPDLMMPALPAVDFSPGAAVDLPTILPMTLPIPSDETLIEVTIDQQRYQTHFRN